MWQCAHREAPDDCDIAAFDHVYRSDYGSIAMVAGATAGSWSSGEDIAQEAFARAHQRWDDVGALERPGAWIRRVAINLALNTRRSSDRERRAVERLREPAGGLVGEIPDLLADTALWDAVAQLPAKQRAAIVLHYHDGYASREIADVLGSSVSAVTTSLHKARATLAQTLGDADQGAGA